MIDVALLTSDRHLAPDPHDFLTSQIIYEESLLLDWFRRHGVRAERVIWDDPSVDWSRIGRAVFRSTWDYHEKIERFSTWLEAVRPQTRLINAAEVIRWNLDKHYLRDLEAAGVAIVPTSYLEKGEPLDLDSPFERFAEDEIVIKPAISAAGADTYRLTRSQAEELKPRLKALLQKGALMAQPFERAILSEGELSLIVIDGRCTHAALKRAKPEEFRVQDDHGGFVLPHEPSDEERSFAEAAVKACPGPVHYARVDVVRGSTGGLRVMEVELIEPELFFRFDRSAAEALAQSLVS